MMIESDPPEDIRSEIAEPDENSWPEWRSLMTGAYSKFHDKLLGNKEHFPRLAEFKIVDRIDKTQGTFAWWWSAAAEVRETINILNSWATRLHEWGAWNMVIESHGCDDDKWDIFLHFVEPVSFFCMNQPSGFTDRIILVSENLLHQANRNAVADYKDSLDQDRSSKGILRRSDRLAQLRRLGAKWKKFEALYNSLQKINNKEYNEKTKNFRDLSAHSLPPRLMSGQLIRAFRAVVPRTQMVAQNDGTFLEKPHPTETAVQYAMHQIPPLELDETRSANLMEHHKALACMDALRELIGELCDRMDAVADKRRPDAQV